MGELYNQLREIVKLLEENNIPEKVIGILDSSENEVEATKRLDEYFEGEFKLQNKELWDKMQKFYDDYNECDEYVLFEGDYDDTISPFAIIIMMAFSDEWFDEYSFENPKVLYTALEEDGYENVAAYMKSHCLYSISTFAAAFYFEDDDE